MNVILGLIDRFSGAYVIESDVKVVLLFSGSLSDEIFMSPTLSDSEAGLPLQNKSTT